MRLVALLFTAVVVGLSAAYAAGPTFAGRTDDAPVTDVAGLQKALGSVQPGGTIHLAAGTFPKFTIQGHRYSAPVKIVGAGPTTVLNGMFVLGSANLAFENIRFAPGGATTTVSVDNSSSVSFSHVIFDGQDERFGAALLVQPKASDVSVSDSTFTQCGHSRACVLAHGTGVSILRNSFDQMIDCDGVRGSGSNVTISGNTFDHALRGDFDNHNDFVQMLGGGPWTITRNKFGQRNAGAAQVFAKAANNNTTLPLHDIRVASNIFYGDMYFAVEIGPGNGSVPAARNVSIVNNTILSGSAAAVRLSSEVLQLPVEQRPLVANNIEAVSKGEICPLAHTSRNLVVSGKPCAGDLTGPANLGPTYEPTSSSSKLIGQADPQYAPTSDFFGHAHGALPDIGAIYFGSGTTASLSLSVPKGLRVSLATLKRHQWKLSATARVQGAVKLQAALRRDGRTIASAAKAPGTAPATTVTLGVSPGARKPILLRIKWTATASDGRKLQRSTIVRIVR
jgi:hypothetical protein